MSKRVVKTTDYCTILQQSIVDKGRISIYVYRKAWLFLWG